VLAAVAVAFALAMGTMPPAEAQSPPAAAPALLPAPSPTPTPGITIISSDISAGKAVSDLGSNFLERLANQATNGVNRIGRSNPGGGGASEATEAPKFRAWIEGYGISSKTDVQGDFAGDRRTTWGSVAASALLSRLASISASPSTRAAAKSTCRWPSSGRPWI
jgi:hypothetical protein